MAAPTFLGATQSGSGDSFSSSKNVTKPSGTGANDIIVLVVEIADANPTVTWPSGFTELNGGSSYLVASGTQWYRVAWKRSTSGEGTGSYTINFGSTVWNLAMAFAVSGARTTGDPFEDVQTTVDASGNSVSGVTVTTTDTDLLVWICITASDDIADGGSGDAVFSPPTSPGAFTEVIDNLYDSIAWYADTTSGSRTVSGGSITSDSAHHGAMVMAFIPEPSGGDGGGDGGNGVVAWLGA